MADFHRLVTPTYFGGLPAGYDYLNTPSDPSVGGSGDPALVDGIKAGGPNDGTYFVSFKEDGLSKAVNRGLAAVGLNTDYLDTLLRTSIPKIKTVDLTAVGSVTSIALTGEIFVGENGMANNSTNRNLLVHITEQSTNNDLEVGGSKITSTLIHDGSNNNVVGTQASGFRTNATVNVSPAIPNGTQYRVWYGIRSSMAEIALTEKGEHFKHVIRTVEHINGTARSLFRQLHSEVAVNQAYDAAWDSTIRSLASSGLNERYRRSTTQPAGFITADYNVAGGGAIITRDGQAVTIKTKDIDITTALYPDANLAGFKVVPELARLSSGATSYNATKGGDIGYWHESDFKNFPAADFTNEVVRQGPAGPALIDVLPRDLRSGTIATHTAITFINDQANATLNPTSGGGANARKEIQCAAGQYFGFTGTSESAIRLKTDLIEVRYQTGPKANTTELYVADFVSAANVIRVKRLNGTDADFGAVAITDVRIRWIQTLVSIGNGGGRDAAEGLGNRNRSFFVTTPSYISDAAASETAGGPAFFGAARETFTDGSWKDIAVEWGGFSGTTGNFFVHGKLFGDGSISCTALAATTVTTSGDITAGDDLISTDDLIVGDDATINGDLTLVGQVLGNLTVQTGLTVGVSITTTTGDIVSGDDVSVGDDLFVTNDIEWGGQLRATSGAVSTQNIGGGTNTLALGATTSIIRINIGGSATIQGIDATGITTSRFVWLLNVDGSDAATLKQNDAGATNAADRFASAISDYSLQAGRGVLLVYDPTLTRWIICSSLAGT